MSEILVTVVVPVYNSQPTLYRCINNIIRSTFAKNMEFILVDDGSYDDSFYICNYFVKEEDKIRIMCQDNLGMGAACNNAIVHARGKYIAFVRQYDVIEADMYETLYKNAVQHDSDMVKSIPYFLFDDKNFMKSGLAHSLLWEEEILKPIAQGNQPVTLLENKALLTCHSLVGSTLYRTDFIKDIKFSTERGTEDQDILFSIKTLIAAKRISVVDRNLYCLNCDIPATSGAAGGESLMCVLDQIVSAKKYLIDHGYFDEFFSEFYKKSITVVFERYNRLRDDLKPVFFARLQDFFSDIYLKKLPQVIKYFTEQEKQFLGDLINSPVASGPRFVDI